MRRQGFWQVPVFLALLGGCLFLFDYLAHTFLPKLALWQETILWFMTVKLLGDALVVVFASVGWFRFHSGLWRDWVLYFLLAGFAVIVIRLVQTYIGGKVEPAYLATLVYLVGFWLDQKEAAKKGEWMR